MSPFSPLAFTSLSPVSIFGLSLFGLSPLLSSLIVGSILLGAYSYWRFFWSVGEGGLAYWNLPGPPPTTFIKGSLGGVIDAQPGVVHVEWIKRYGRALWYFGFLRAPRIYIADPVAMNYVLTQADIFPKDPVTRDVLARFLGNGLLVAEGDDHRRQRKIMQPAFAPKELRDNHLPIFFMKAHELKDVLHTLINPTDSTDASEIADSKNTSTRIDVSGWISKATQDIIGLSGFDYDFQCLSSPTNELAAAYKRMFVAGQQIDMWVILGTVLPGMHRVPTKRHRTQTEAFNTVNRIGKKLVEDKKTAILAGGGDVKAENEGKDLLSLIIRANLDPNLSANQRMSDSEVLGQISTFILAGQETSANLLTWAFWRIAQQPAVQARLREECVSIDSDSPSMAELDSLPYLQAVVAEALRLNGPVPNTVRKATEQTVIPLGKPILGRDGTMIESIVCPPKTTLLLGLLAMNVDSEFWGEDAWEFRPERWLTEDGQPKNACNTHLPGIWSNLMAFLGGQHGCIGYRFAVAEIKAIMFVLVRSFIFEECDPKVDIIGKTSIVTRPVIRGEESKGMQMPLMMRLV